MREGTVASSIRPHQTFQITILPKFVFLMMQMLVCSVASLPKLLLIELVEENVSVAEEQVVSTPFEPLMPYVVD